MALDSYFINPGYLYALLSLITLILNRVSMKLGGHNTNFLRPKCNLGRRGKKYCFI